MKKCITGVDINSDLCPFCHSQQTKEYVNDSGDIVIYSYCKCDAMRAFLAKRLEYRSLVEEYKYIKNRITRREDQAEREIRMCGLGKRYQDASFDNFDRSYCPVAYDAALKYSDEVMTNEGAGLIIYGDTGTGKTHLAAAIARKLAYEHGAKIAFVNYAQVLSDMRDSFSTGSGYSAEIEKKMHGADVLILDDLGKEKQSEFSNGILYQAINRRYESMMPLIITTNYSLQELQERMTESIFSRVAGMCKAVTTEGIDFRLRALYC